MLSDATKVSFTERNAMIIVAATMKNETTLAMTVCFLTIESSS